MNRTTALYVIGGITGLGALAWWWLSRSSNSNSNGAPSSSGYTSPDFSLENFFNIDTGGQDFMSYAANLGNLNAPRGIRNNNPGNIKKNGTAWQGLAPAAEQTDDTFCVFSEAKWGIRAIARIMFTKQSRGLVTVRQMISGPGGWAPTGTADQNPAVYAQTVANAMGVDPDQAISLNASLPLLTAMVTSIIRFENGQQPYSDAYITAAVQL